MYVSSKNMQGLVACEAPNWSYILTTYLLAWQVIGALAAAALLQMDGVGGAQRACTWP